MPRDSATAVRTVCGTWVEVCSTTCPVRSSNAAMQARPSIGAAVTRPVDTATSTTWAAEAKISSRPGDDIGVTSTSTLPGAQSCTAAAPAASASPALVTAGSSR